MKNYFYHKYENLDGYASAIGDDIFGSGIAEDVFANDMSGVAAPEGTPFIVTLQNTTNTAISDVAFLDATNGIIAGASQYGVTSGITPGYGIPGEDYIDFLYFLQRQIALIGKTYIYSATAAQLHETIKVESSNMRGDSFSTLIDPTVNTFANQTTSVVVNKPFILNAKTKLTYSSIAANATVQLKFYPKVDGSQLGQLQPGVGKAYGTPSIDGMQIIQPGPAQPIAGMGGSRSI